MVESGVILYVDVVVLVQLQVGFVKVVVVKVEEYDDEFLLLDLNVEIVSDFDDVIVYICEYGI